MSKRRMMLVVDALRSGKYARGWGALRNGDNYCIEGVCCDIYAKETGKGRWDGKYVPFYNDVPFRTEMGDYDTSAGSDVVFWFTTPEANLAEWRLDRGVYRHLNDEGMGFSELADMIESDLADDGKQTPWTLYPNDM